MPEAFDSGERSNPDYDVPLRRPPFPILVTMAGIAWIGFGGLIFLNVVVLVVLTSALTPGGPEKAGEVAGMLACGSCLPVLFGVGFTFVGAQSVRGTAKDTLGNGIGSIIIGVLIVGIAVVQIGLAQLPAMGQRPGAPPAAPWGLALAAIISGACGVGLVAAGILALVGRNDYRAWRRSQKPAREDDWNRGDRRRRRDEEDDRDDEPRRRKRGDDDDKFRT